MPQNVICGKFLQKIICVLSSGNMDLIYLAKTIFWPTKTIFLFSRIMNLLLQQL